MPERVRTRSGAHRDQGAEVDAVGRAAHLVEVEPVLPGQEAVPVGAERGGARHHPLGRSAARPAAEPASAHAPRASGPPRFAAIRVLSAWRMSQSSRVSGSGVTRAPTT